MPAEFVVARRVQFAETDMAGVMHFSNYFRWMEEIEHAWMRGLGMSVMHSHTADTVSWPRVTVSCEYHAPARFEDEIELRLNVTDLTEKSMTYEVTFWRDGNRIARGRIKAVCCRMESGRFTSVPIPPTIRKLLGSALQ